MTSISSRPNAPLSPLCGLSPHTATRGDATPDERSPRVRSSTPSAMPSRVRSALTSLSGTCDVTRDVHSDSSTLNSTEAPVKPRSSQK